MRILHTADWHLGRSLGEHRLLSDQQAFLAWLVSVVADAEIDLVIVAGDVFDRAVPPVEAVELFGDALVELRGAGADVVAIAGNHDGAARLAAFAPLTDLAGVFLRGGYRNPGEVVVRSCREQAVAIVPVPYLDPLLAPPGFIAPGSGLRANHEGVLATWMRAARAAVPAGLPSVAVAHAFVAGALPSDSERELAVGSAGRVSAPVLEGFDYVALGHLHRPQTVGGRAAMRYSGSPLAYGFAEVDPKQVVIADVTAGRCDVEVVAVPVGRRVATVRGRFADLVSDPDFDDLRPLFLRVELTDPAPVLDARRQLEARFPFLVEIIRVGAIARPDLGLRTGPLAPPTPFELASWFWADVTGEKADAAVAQVFADAIGGVLSGGGDSMRPGRLELVAFGPFADRQVVDIDSLGELGLFVIAGPTGSGKTSLFDAMCYALYGVLPGARSSVRRPRSDHAAPSVRSEVVFDFDAGGERWRVRRRPAHLRPKRRGTGTIEDPADAVLFRLESGGWQAVTTRAPEVDARCIELVGLDADQFQRVVLLPQGRFQQLLHARSIERRDLLRTLFASETFEQVERRLIELAGAASSAAERSTEERRRLVASASAEVEAALEGLAAWSHDEAPSPGSPGPVSATADEPVGVALLDLRIAQELDPALVALGRRRVETSESARAAADLATRAREHNDRLTRHAALKAGHTSLSAERPDRERSLEAVAAARRAGAVVAASERVEGCEQEVTRRRHDLDQVTAELSRLVDQQSIGLGGLGDLGELGELGELGDLGDLGRRLAALIADLAAAVGEVERARSLERDHAVVEAEIGRFSARESDLARDLDQFVHLLGDLDRRLNAAAPVAARIEVREAVGVAAGHLVELARERDHASIALVRSRATRVALEADLAALRSKLEHARGELAESRSAAAQVGERTVVAELAQETARRRGRLDAVDTALTEAIHALESAQQRAAAVISAFIVGAARRLALTLTDGEACPVCGSCEHPHTAVSTPGGGSVADLDDAAPLVDAARVDQAQLDVSTAVAEVARRRAQQQELIELLGPESDRSAAALAADAAAAWTAREEAVQQADLAPLHETEVVRLDELMAGVMSSISSEIDHAAEIETQLTSLRARLGDHAAASVAEAEAVAAAAHTAVGEARAAAALVVELGDQRLGIEATRAEIESERSTVLMTVAEQRVRAKSLATESARIRAVVADRFGVDDPAELLAAASTVSSAVELVGARRRALESAQQVLVLTAAERDATLEQNGFESLALAIQMALPGAEIEAREASHAHWCDALARIEGGLVSLEAQGLPSEPHDLVAVVAIAERAEDLARQLVAAEATLRECRSRIEVGRRAIDQLDRESGPSRQRAERLHQVAEVCRGRNIRNTSLESWVLSSHLREVVAQANLHLAPMTGGRFRLAVADEVIDRRALAGLDIEVDDDDTGCRRPTSTLSGGETFQASLALALGLADVVSAGASGIRVDAVFIDEGFGSLDPESLDLAIDTLDRLRTRGALVGVVTHVEALKQALPVGVEVVRRRDGAGSAVRQPGLPRPDGAAAPAGLGVVADVA